MTTQSTGFKDNFKILKDTADQMRDMSEPDIDQVIPMVDRATAAYAACKERIDAAEKLLAEKLPVA